MVGFMFQGSLDDFVSQCSEISSEMAINYSEASPSFQFSNTGRRGATKHFSVTVAQLVSVLKDIDRNLTEFSDSYTYVEATWRQLFASNVSDGVVNALATVQTLPLYALINKVLCVSNGLEKAYEEKAMQLSSGNLQEAITYLSEQQDKIDNSVSDCIRSDVTESTFDAINKIYYGAPGTGKSHTINRLTIGNPKVVTVFHPETQYSDFVGALKPRMAGKDITYEFRPGPFTRALLLAMNNPTVHVHLIIEEINRAPAAAVFGELFQLLDRKNTGESQYAIDAADPDMLDYLNTHINGRNIEKLIIPENLSLLATMNSSDQAVMPLDTAFKRRWSFEYLKIDFTNADVVNQMLTLKVADGSDWDISWADFADNVVNAQLKAIRVPEDRLLGPFFLAQEELSSPASIRGALAGKLFVYLWDDVLRHKGTQYLFSSDLITFGDLYQYFVDNSIGVFCEAVNELIMQYGTLKESTKAAESVNEDE